MRLVTTADGSRTLYSERYGQSYHSRLGALTEARHVFLEASGVQERLDRKEATNVLEVGFGTGLNFLVTAAAATPAGVQLDYTSLEHELLPAHVLAELGYGIAIDAPELFDAFLTWRESIPEQPSTGAVVGTFPPSTRLTVHLGDALAVGMPENRFDAIYLDAFSPDANPELWAPDFLERLFIALQGNRRLTTYSVSGDVRRTLESVGFAIEKRPGPPGGKREMLIAWKP